MSRTDQPADLPFDPDHHGSGVSLSALNDPGLALPQFKPGQGLTEPQHRFLHWLSRRGGSAVHCIRKNRPGILAQGDVFWFGSGPQRSAFLFRLEKSGYLEYRDHRLILKYKAELYTQNFPLHETFQGVHTGRVDPKPHAE